MAFRFIHLAILTLVMAGWSPAREPMLQIAQNAESGDRPMDATQLAERDMKVGRYYIEKRNYVAAINRFKTVITQYSNSAFAEEALAGLAEAYSAIGITSEAQCAVAALQRKFPDSPWSHHALDALKATGLEPAENENSYISCAFK